MILVAAEEWFHLRESVSFRLEHGRAGQTADSCSVAGVSIFCAHGLMKQAHFVVRLSVCVGWQMRTRRLRLTGYQK